MVPITGRAHSLYFWSFQEIIIERRGDRTTDLSIYPKTDFEHAHTHFRLRILGHDRHTDIYIYISREISIEHHSVGLASLAQLYCMHFNHKQANSRIIYSENLRN